MFLSAKQSVEDYGCVVTSMVEARQAEAGFQGAQQREVVDCGTERAAVLRVIGLDQHNDLVGRIAVIVLVPHQDDDVAPLTPSRRALGLAATDRLPASEG